MKKIFSLFAAVLFAGSMMAAVTVTFVKGDFTKSGDVISASKDGISITCVGNVPSSGTYVTLNEGNKLTISCSEGNINAIDFSTSSADYTGNLADVSGLSVPSWELAVDNPGKKTTVRVVSFAVTYTSTAAVAKPVIESKANYFFEGEELEVAISCETEGAAIYYTLDGTEPSATSLAYAAAFKLTEAATVKAIAIKGDDKSKIAEKAITVYPVYASLEALAEAKPANGTPVKVTFTDAEITSFLSGGKGLFVNVVVDTKNLEFYYATDSEQTVPEAWAVGGKLSGTLVGTWTLYNSQWEVIPFAGFKWTDLNYTAPSATAIDNTAVEAKAVKYFENGQLVIIKNGVKYNAVGSVVK